jgi:protein-arginine kinase activator protein McsA
MLVNGVRLCDACNKPIASSDDFTTSTIPREKASIFLELFAQTANASSPTITAQGTVELTICRRCDSTMATLPDKLLD